MSEYASDVLVSPAWVAERLETIRDDDPALRLVEIDVDTDLYDDAHIPGAVGFDWQADLQDARTFDTPPRAEFERLLGEAGLTEKSTVVLYGDMMNWFAAYGYWLFKYYGHADVRLLDGGRQYWLENDYPVTDEQPSFTPRSYTAGSRNDTIRVDRLGVEAAIGEATLVDVRSPPEYRGEILAPPGWNEGVQRGGHIPGAINVPWSEVVTDEGQFKSAADLKARYEQAGVTNEDEIIVYCRIGERSALAWVVLHELLGFDSVRHYYGSWVEWGNTVGAPIEGGEV